MLKQLIGALAAAALWGGAAMAQTAPAPQRINPVKTILVGVSTTAVIGGWGPGFCADHVTSFVACLNLARGGRSSSSYRAEGSWDVALGEMAAPGYAQTYVLIQFGHNDQPGKPGRSTDLATEFPANMRRYVEETRARGAVPILLTPLTRRQFVNGQLQNDLAPWAEAVRRVAVETGAPLIDLNAKSAEAVQALGPVLSAQFAQVAPSADVAAALFTGTTISAQPAPSAPTPAPLARAAENAAAEPLGQARLSFDYTHLGDEGSAFFSAMVTRELIVAVPALRGKLVP